MKFSKNFLIGASTAAHQVEGNNTHSDLWAMEHMKNTTYAEPSLDAVDHYNKYEEDIRLMAEAGLNAYRFGIEWARIEPEEGVFDVNEVEHYRKVLTCCKDNGIEPIVTLHHFSSPKWLMGKGGWEEDTTPVYFARYVQYVMEHIGREMHYVCTINEANMGLQIMSIVKRMFAQIAAKEQAQNRITNSSGTDNHDEIEGKVQMGLSLEKMMARSEEAAEENRQIFGVTNPATFQLPRTEHGDRLIMEAHIAAKKVIREVCPNIKVGLTLSLHDIQALPGGEERAAQEWIEEFKHYLPAISDDDFIGVQNYTRACYDQIGDVPIPDGIEVTQMGYEFYPQGLEHVIRKVAEDFHGDILITENGIATSDDSRRITFIEQALQGVRRCVDDGLPVKAYLHWSLLDNFEWQKGYAMTFGLIAVDRNTQTRKPKPSLGYLGEYCAV